MNEFEIDTNQLLGNASDGRSLTFDALKAARENKFDLARIKLNEAKIATLKAHEIHTELMNAISKVNIAKKNLLIHTQNHLTTSTLTRELVEKLVELYKDISTK